MEKIKIILTYFGGVSVVLFAIVGFSFEIIKKKIFSVFEKKINIELENIKAQLHISEIGSESLVNGLAGIQSINQQEKITAIKELWNSIITIRNISSTATTFYAMIDPSEYNTIYTNSFIKQLLGTTLNLESMNEINKVEPYRPFIVNKIWTLYQVYFSFNLRLQFFLDNGYKNKDIKSWIDDDGMSTFLESFFTTSEINKIIPQNIITIKLAMENQILDVISSFLHGESNIALGLEQINKIQTAIINTQLEMKTK